MNCKPGEMAVIVRNTCHSICVESVKGFVIQVEQSAVTERPVCLDVWTYKGPRLRCQHGNVFNFLLDADLQPIRGLPQGEGEGRTEPRPVEATDPPIEASAP